MQTQGPTYTAAELAAAVNREFGTDISTRTVYYYRAKGVLSPLEMIGSQPKFTERHRLELRAALALQRSMDRPNLAEIGERLRALEPDQLDILGAAPPPTTDEMLGRSVLMRLSAASPVMSLRETPGDALQRTGPHAVPAARRRTIEITPAVALRIAEDLPGEFVRDLIELIRDYCRNHGEESCQC
jgi:DNA-binding transcriptional MerR regulator